MVERTNLRPSRVAELAEAVASAARDGARVRLTGSDSMPLTRFADSPIPPQTISTLRMNKVIEHAIADMTVIVQAGITLEALQRQLAWQDQWLPVDPPAPAGRTPGNRTIGGLIASNSLGPLRFGCGDWRLLIMGMKWVDSRGTLIKGGGRTVKNVAGYSSPRMMIGSCGSLGAIAEVTLRTFTRPADERCVIVFCESPEHSEALLSAIMLAPITPAYVQLMGGQTFAGNPLDLPSIGDVGGQGAGMAIVVGFLGRPEVCAAQLETVRQLPEAKGFESIAQTAAQAGRLRLWMTSEPAAGETGAGFRIHVRSYEVAGVVSQIEGLGRSRNGNAGAWVVSEAGTGVVRGVLTCPDAPRALLGLLKQTRGGHLVGTQGHWKISESSSNGVASRLKQILDPAGVMGKCDSA